MHTGVFEDTIGDCILKLTTVMVTVSLFLAQEELRLEVTTYLVVTVGDATGFLQDVQLRVESGLPPGNTDHVKVEPPTASSVVTSL